MWKIIVRLIWSAEKSDVVETVIKIGQSGLSMQAVPLAGSKPLQILLARGRRPNKKINVNVLL